MSEPVLVSGTFPLALPGALVTKGLTPLSPGDLEADPRVVLPTPPPPSPRTTPPARPHHRTACQGAGIPSPPHPKAAAAESRGVPPRRPWAFTTPDTMTTTTQRRSPSPPWQQQQAAAAASPGAPSDARQPHYGAPAPRVQPPAAWALPPPLASARLWFRRHDVCPAPPPPPLHGPF